MNWCPQMDAERHRLGCEMASLSLFTKELTLFLVLKILADFSAFSGSSSFDSVIRVVSSFSE